MKDKLKAIKEMWLRLTDDGSIKWQQESLNEYGKRYVYDIVMKQIKEKPHLRTVLVSYDDELIGERTFEYESDEEDIDSTLPIEHAQVIIDNFEREIKLKLYLHSQDGVINWKEFKKQSGESNKRKITLKPYGKEAEVVEVNETA